MAYLLPVVEQGRAGVCVLCDVRTFIRFPAQVLAAAVDAVPAQGLAVAAVEVVRHTTIRVCALLWCS